MEKIAYPIKEFFSKGGHLASPWDNLSIREKAEMMKVAVRNGITNLPDIKQKYNEFAEGGEIESPVENSNIYAGGSYLDIAKKHIKKNEDWLPKPYKDAPKGKNWRSVGYGFNDSGFRSKYPQGISKYYENGITEAQAEKELNWFLGGAVNHLKKVYGRKWDSFNDNQKAAIIDTYYQRPASVVGKGSQFYRAVMAGDKNAGNYLGVAGYGNRNKDRRKLFGASQIERVAPTQGVPPISEPIQSIPEDTVDFIPWNPQAFFGVNNNTPIIIHQETPVVEERMPTPEEIERQERQQGLANFQTIMGMLNSTSDNTSATMTPFESTVSMLTQQSPIHYFSDGGSIHIKPENRGKFTRLKERAEHPEGDNTNGPKFKESQEAYYDKDTDTIYAPNSTGEFYHHEMFHARPNSIELERLKPYYENLDDNRLLELGADLPFIKRMDNDPGYFYSPEEVGARVNAAKYMLNNAGINKVDNIFLDEARKNEDAYGNNFRDLLHMYNNENLIGIFNNSYSSGGKIYIKPENRGKFTALKERTGHSASWFKENGTPAQKKMATFALNARHWKHGLGGNLFDSGGDTKAGIPVDYLDPLEVMPLVADNMGKSIVLDEQVVTPYKKLPMQSDFFEGETNQAANERADEYAKRVAPTAEDLFTIGTLGGLSNLSPTQWVRRAYDLGKAIKGNMSWDNFGNNWFYGNNGLVSDKYAQEHPYASAAINLVGDAGAFGTLSALRKLPKYAALMDAENRAAQEATAINWRDMFANSARRTRLGDVEVDNPILNYRVGTPEMVDDFIDSGEVRAGKKNYQKPKMPGRFLLTKEVFQNPMFKQGSLWYQPSEEMSGLLVTPEELVTATKSSAPVANNGVFTIDGKTFINDFGGRRIPGKGQILDASNTSAYRWKPGDGYRRVLAEEAPTVEWADAANMTPKVNWDADNWFKTISGRSSYSSEEAAELASHVPEYRAIEQRLFNEGKLIYDSNGNIIVDGYDMSPQEYIMRQSEAFQKMNPEHHYVGVSKRLRDNFENEARDPNTRNKYEVWTDRKSPKNVEEYAVSQQGGYTNDSVIERLQREMTRAEEDYKLFQEQLKRRYELGITSKENYDRELAALRSRKDNYTKNAQQELDVLIARKQTDPLNGGKIFDVTYPKEAVETPIIDAENSHWSRVPFDNVVRDAPNVVTHYKQRPFRNELQTDQIVSAARRNGYGVTHIDNVMDTYDGTMLNETIIGRDTPVKSVLGNTGSFDIESPNKWRLYRSLIPPFLGLGAAAADSTKALGGNLFEIGGPKNSKKKGEPEYMFDSTRYTHPNDTAGLLAEQVVTPNGNYPVLNPKGGEAWTIEALNDLGVPLYTKTSIPKQKDVELQHLEDKAKADEFVSKTIGNGEAFTPWGLFGLLINEGVGAAASALPESAQEVLAKGRYISPSYWIDRGTGLSDEQLMSGKGKLFGTGTGTMFDILSTKGIGKGADVAATKAANTFSKIRQFNRLEKNYTGVPHKELKGAPGTYMDEVFPNNHTQHTIWSTDDIDYPRTFDGPDRTVYDVYTDPKELSILETPSVPEDKMLYWQGLPYKLENGKVSFADNLSSEQAWIPRSKDISLKKGGIGGNYTPDEVASYIMKDGENGLILDWKKAPGTISTDDVVKYSLDNGYDATRFNRVFDGASEIDGTLYDYPINELVLNPNTPRYVLPHGTSKLRLWNQLPTKYSQSNYFATSLPYTTLFRNYTNNE